MDFMFGEKEERLREEIREFAKKELPPGWLSFMLEEEDRDEDWAFALSMSRKLSEKGWLTMSWPKEYGGMGASPWEQLVYCEEASYWGIPGTTMGIGGIDWVGPSLMLFGPEEQKKKYVPMIASGEPDGVWCTAYSEPNAGCDFADIKTRAVKQGDRYIINGHKIWTSAAHRARWCWLAVKTDPKSPKKHQGISVFIVDMKSKGITVRPLENYAGYHLFNEIFFDDVSVPTANLVGKENNGWKQVMHALGFERGSVGGRGYGYNRRILDELIDYSREIGLFSQLKIRHKLADIAISLETQKILVYETTWKVSKGIVPVYEPSRDKVFQDHILEELATTGMEILGEYSQMDPIHQHSKWTKIHGHIEGLYWLFPGLLFAAGTDEVEMNIIGQFGLDLPKSY